MKRVEKILEKGSKKEIKDLKNIADHLTELERLNRLPPELKEKLKKKNGLKKIQKGILGLTTRPKRVIQSRDLTSLYLRGVQKMSINDIRTFFKCIAINPSNIRNISFITTDICEILMLKYYKNTFISIMESFDKKFQIINDDEIREFKVLEDLENDEKMNEDIIYKNEWGKFKRINNIIHREKLPECVKSFYENDLKQTTFLTLNEKGERKSLEKDKDFPGVNLQYSDNEDLSEYCNKTPSQESLFSEITPTEIINTTPTKVVSPDNPFYVSPGSAINFELFGDEKDEKMEYINENEKGKNEEEEEVEEEKEEEFEEFEEWEGVENEKENDTEKKQKQKEKWKGFLLKKKKKKKK